MKIYKKINDKEANKRNHRQQNQANYIFIINKQILFS